MNRNVADKAMRDYLYLFPDASVVEGGRLYTLLERHPNLYADLSTGSGLGALQRDPQVVIPSHCVKL